MARLRSKGSHDCMTGAITVLPMRDQRPRGNRLAAQRCYCKRRWPCNFRRAFRPVCGHSQQFKAWNSEALLPVSEKRRCNTLIVVAKDFKIAASYPVVTSKLPARYQKRQVLANKLSCQPVTAAYLHKSSTCLSSRTAAEELNRHSIGL